MDVSNPVLSLAYYSLRTTYKTIAVITKSTEETKEAGRRFSADLKGGEVVALIGDLGAGKTTFVQGLAVGLDISNNVPSPTFIIMRTYTLENQKFRNLYHFDLYRLEDNIESELINLGIKDIWNNKENVSVIEWAEKADKILPIKSPQTVIGADP